MEFGGSWGPNWQMADWISRESGSRDDRHCSGEFMKQVFPRLSKLGKTEARHENLSISTVVNEIKAFVKASRKEVSHDVWLFNVLLIN